MNTLHSAPLAPEAIRQLKSVQRLECQIYTYFAHHKILVMIYDEDIYCFYEHCGDDF